VDQHLPETGFEYDLVVVGGGSGGLACSKEAARFGKKVAVLDFVKPSPAGTVWGLGGTCVNVGCIPKKLMHNAGLVGDTLSKDAKFFGWKLGEKPTFNWEDLVNNVQDYIGSLNFGYRTDLRSKRVEYINAYGVFKSPHEMELSYRDGKKKTITARRFVIATGGRPKYPGIPGDKEHCITSDDIFSMSTAPGKTLVVGASYVN
jgi:thioredoxin reductase (NADPH)